MSVTSSYKRYYQQLGKLSLDSNFDAEWKDEVESNMAACQNCVKMSF